MEKEISNVTDIKVNENGKISFAPDVIATIAGLAATEVEGVSSLGGTVADSISAILGSKKSLTKGVRVEVGSEEAAVDISINVKYGCKIQNVCANVQKEIKIAIENMTGLRVVEVNVFVQSVTFQDSDKKKKDKVEVEPRVK